VTATSMRRRQCILECLIITFRSMPTPRDQSPFHGAAIVRELFRQVGSQTGLESLPSDVVDAGTHPKPDGSGVSTGIGESFKTIRSRLKAERTFRCRSASPIRDTSERPRYRAPSGTFHPPPTNTPIPRSYSYPSPRSSLRRSSDPPRTPSSCCSLRGHRHPAP